MKSIVEYQDSVFPNRQADWRQDHETFHESTKITERIYAKQALRVVEYLTAHREIDETFSNHKYYRLAPKTPLLSPERYYISMNDLMLSRRSIRSFEPDQTIGLQDWSTILTVGMSTNRKVTNAIYKDLTGYLRNYPSPGGLYPTEVYLMQLKDGDGLSRGLYHYNVIHRALCRIGEAPEADQLTDKVIGLGNEIANVPTILLFSSTFERSITKYGNRGYRFALIECGILAQNLAISSHVAGFSNCFWGGYEDQKIDGLLGLNGVDETVTNLIVLGVESDSSRDAIPSLPKLRRKEEALGEAEPS